ncbi:MAG: 1-acyl-sn-glycerol-3-phosphate acyltransferase [Candidatus Melainabacteria bacterium]|nr:1-acyl-sn-glycerol-3-phosphate acyltransferase [Candidatus Melainabacteria bacterium]
MLSRIEAKLVKISQSFFYFFVWMTHYLLFSPFLSIKVIGKENIPKRGRFILAGNHKNFLDGYFLSFAIGPFKKVSFVIAKRALRPKPLQILARLIGSVLIGNEIEEYQRAIKKLNRILSHGGCIGIFPEGDVSNRSTPRKFKGGVARLSLDSTTKVVPIYLTGTYNLRYLKYWLKRPEILIKIGKPVELYKYASVYGNNLDEMAAFLREKIIELAELNEIKKNINLDLNNSSDSEPLLNILNEPKRKSHVSVLD